MGEAAPAHSKRAIRGGRHIAYSPRRLRQNDERNPNDGRTTDAQWIDPQSVFGDVQRLASRFFRNRATGKIVLVQAPNVPLWAFIVATIVRMVAGPRGPAATVLAVVGTTALGVWAMMEIGWGVSPFRRTLGAAVLGVEIVMWLPH